MRVQHRSLIYAIGVALLVHAVLFVGVRMADQPAPVAGASGMRLALAPSPSAATANDSLDVVTSEREPVPEEVAPEPELEPEKTIERKPVQPPQPDLPVRRARETTPAPEANTAPPAPQSSPSAGAAGSTGTVTAAGESGVGDVNAQADYIAQVTGWLARHKRYPRQAQRRRQEGVVYLAFTVSREGRVSNARLVETSGYALLDREVEAMIERAEPLPSFPPSLDKSYLDIVVPVRFALSQR